MLCDICKKNEATIHIQEIIGGQKKSLHLCSSCAAAREESSGLDFGPFNLAGLLYKLAGEKNGREEADDRVLTCDVCHWSDKKLKQTGRLGCENCYKVFAPLLAEALKDMHNNTTHIGKQPVGKGTELCNWHRELAALQKELQRAVEIEDYESAAVLRDSINELKQRCEKSAAGGEKKNEK